MKKISALFAVILTVFAFSSCDLVVRNSVKGNGELKRISRNVAKADRIKVSDGIDVIISKGSTGVEVEADENLLRYIETRYDDGWLIIRAKDNYQLRSENNITVRISTEMLRALKVAGSGNVSSEEDWSMGGTFKLDVAGSGDVVLNVRANDIEADIAGSGNIELAGTSDNLNLDIAGSGNFRGYELKCNTVDIDVAGAGEAEVTAEEKLKVSIAGSGDIKYRGNATVSKSVAGSGSIQKTD